MKYFKFGLLIILIFGLNQCNTGTLHTNEIALELVTQEREGEIRQSERKDDFILFFEDVLVNNFISEGYGYRINEIKENWNVYEDKGFVILTGSIAKTDNDIYVFTIVYKDQSEGLFDNVYKQIGNKKTGNYPTNIIPN